jgi:hypothetical protein
LHELWPDHVLFDRHGSYWIVECIDGRTWKSERERRAGEEPPIMAVFVVVVMVAEKRDDVNTDVARVGAIESCQ